MQLQKGPLGLLGAFALKVLGQNPPNFGDTVIPIADVYDQYLATSELQIQRAAMATALATFTSTSFTVPAGKVWRLIAASMAGANNAADAALVSTDLIGLLSPNSTVFSVNIAQGALQTGAAVIRGVAVTLRPPIFLPSGWSISFGRSQSAAVTVTANVQVGCMYQEFDL
jgi:hypothetical protein